MCQLETVLPSSHALAGSHGGLPPPHFPLLGGQTEQLALPLHSAGPGTGARWPPMGFVAQSRAKGAELVWSELNNHCQQWQRRQLQSAMKPQELCREDRAAPSTHLTGGTVVSLGLLFCQCTWLQGGPLQCGLPPWAKHLSQNQMKTKFFWFF